MNLAETAHVAVQMDLTGNYAAAIKSAEAETRAFAASAGGIAAGGVSKLEQGFGKLGGALGHAKSQIGGLLTGPLGILGLGAGIFTLAGAIDTGINKAADMGLEVSKLTALTGDSAESMSALAAAFEHFNISSQSTIKAVGMLEKNVGLLAAKKDGLVNFRKEFGFALTDSSGHIKDANALILTASDYFNNKLIPATTKAAALSKLFGRAWVELIPLLQQGSQGILDAEAAAKDLGLTLTQTNINDLAKFKESTRELGTAIGGLELQVGLALVPAIKGMAETMTKFIRDNRTSIVQFFKDAATNVQKFGDFLSRDVIPPLQTFGSAAAKAWAAVPDPLKQILIGGIIANKAGKFLFNIGIGDLAKGLGGIGGSLLSRGGTPADPLYVADVTPGGKLPIPPIGPGGEPLTNPGGSPLEGLSFFGGASIGGLTVNAADPTIQKGKLEHPEMFGGSSSGVVATGAAIGGLAAGIGRAVATLTHIDSNTAALLAEQKAAHQKAKEAVGGSGKDFHEFLLAFRSGSATVAIKDFSKELAYLSTASAETKRGTTFVQGVKENIKALEKAEVGATASQKLVLSADIKKLQALISTQKSQQHTDAAQIKSESAKARAAMVAALRNPPSVTVNVSTKVTTDSITRSTSVSRRYGPAVAT